MEQYPIFQHFLIISTIQAVLCETPNSMHVVTLPLELGRNVILKCNQECCSRNSSTHWRIENENTSIFAANEPKKYEIFGGHYYCFLMIKNLTVEDMQSNYTCYNGFLTFNGNLKPTKDNFIYVPVANEIISNIDSESRTIKISVERVYPSLKCDNNLNSHVSTNVKVKEAVSGIFYSYEILVQIPTLPGKYILNCSVKNREIIREGIIIPSSYRNESPAVNMSAGPPYYSKDCAEKELAYISISILAVLLLALAIYVLITKKQCDQCISSDSESEEKVEETSMIKHEEKSTTQRSNFKKDHMSSQKVEVIGSTTVPTPECKGGRIRADSSVSVTMSDDEGDAFFDNGNTAAKQPGRQRLHSG